jgi:hypothetical protein
MNEDVIVKYDGRAWLVAHRPTSIRAKIFQ